MPKVKVGIVGEIYVKYSPLGNNELEKFLESEDCEVNMPGLMGFLEYCIFNMGEDVTLYGGKANTRRVMNLLLRYLDGIEIAADKALSENGFHAPARFAVLKTLPEGVIGMGAKMGEGWLLTAEMIELIESGYENIVCAQPFGCLPNHVVGKGMVNRLRAMHPTSNITPIDYDPSATRVNQENRIKLMLAALSVARERLQQKNAPVQPMELYGETPRVEHHIPDAMAGSAL